MNPFVLRVARVARRTDNGCIDTIHGFVGTPVLFPLAFKAHEDCLAFSSGGGFYVAFQDAAFHQAGIPYGGVDLLPEARAQAFIFDVSCTINGPCASFFARALFAFKCIFSTDYTAAGFRLLHGSPVGIGAYILFTTPAVDDRLRGVGVAGFAATFCGITRTRNQRHIQALLAIRQVPKSVLALVHTSGYAVFRHHSFFPAFATGPKGNGTIGTVAVPTHAGKVDAFFLEYRGT